MLENIWTIFLKEIIQIFRNKESFLVFIVAPILYVLIYGYALNPDIKNVRLGILDYSNTQNSRDLISLWNNSNIFTTPHFLKNQQDFTKDIELGKVEVGLIIPPDFDSKIKKNDLVELQVIISSVDANKAGLVYQYVKQITNRYQPNYTEYSDKLLIQISPRILYNPGAISSWYFVPGVIGIILTVISVFSGASVITNEKDYGSLEQLIITPIMKQEILLGKILVLFFVVFNVFLAIMFFSLQLFSLPFQGNFFLFAGASVCYILAIIELGILLGIASSSLLQAFLLSFFVNIPILQLSGTYTSIESMPSFFQTLSQFNPLRHYVAIMRSIILKGIGLEAIWTDLLFLMVLTIILFFVCFRQFQKKIG
jgi:ABC-2 type transport system permease protein